jgi:hypothetical protein
LANLRSNISIHRVVQIFSEFKFARTFCLLFGPAKSRPPEAIKDEIYLYPVVLMDSSRPAGRE